MIITLCGSTCFEERFHYWNEKFTLEGHAVFSLAVFPSTKGEKEWYDDGQKMILDLVHKQKIDASDAIFVITTGENVESRDFNHDAFEPYIGYSTRSEITHASKRRKTVLYDFKEFPTVLPLHLAVYYWTCK